MTEQDNNPTEGQATPSTERGASPPAETPSKDARMWAMFSHLAALAGIVLPVVGCVVGPLVVWLIKREESPFIDQQGKEAVNFQISMLIYTVAAICLALVSCGFLVPLPFAVGVVNLVFIIIAGIKANDGTAYRYPITMRFVK